MITQRISMRALLALGVKRGMVDYCRKAGKDITIRLPTWNALVGEWMLATYYVDYTSFADPCGACICGYSIDMRNPEWGDTAEEFDDVVGVEPEYIIYELKNLGAIAKRIMDREAEFTAPTYMDLMVEEMCQLTGD